MEAIEFAPFPKMARMSRDVVITEKLDGTNAQVIVTEDGRVGAASRTRLITPEDDNFGFARWVEGNKADLLLLGPGRHFGEWFGQGIQRNYGLGEKRFALFNTHRWTAETAPACCHVVPIIHTGDFQTSAVEAAIETLRQHGSYAAPGFMKPEGVVVYHTAANFYFKKTLDRDDAGKTFGA